MAGLRKTNLYGGVAALAVLAVVAGCGSSSSSTTSKTTSASASSSSASVASSSAPGVAVGTAKGADGTYLVGPSGRALYLWVADTGSRSTCSGACAQAWPPLITTGTPTASGAVNASDLGTSTRADGSKQVTYKGHPLYYFIADRSSGAVKGQGSDSFGAKWWLVAPSGAAITSAKTSGAGSSSGSSGSGGSSGYGGGYG